jgi:hypothetical protein
MNAAYRSKKMVNQGSPLTPEYKKAIICVKKYFDRIKGDLEEISYDSVEKTAHALEVGEATVKRVIAIYNKDPDQLDKEPFRRGCPQRAISDSAQ